MTREQAEKEIRDTFTEVWADGIIKAIEQEPTTQERQAESDKFDAAFQDGYNNGYAQARFDYEQEPTTKNDLEVDCISRQQAIDAFPDLLPNIGYNKKAITEVLQELPSVTPQEPILDKIRAEIKEKIEQEDFTRSVFRNEEKDTAKAEQCTGSIMAYNNVIKLIDKYKAESEE